MLNSQNDNFFLKMFNGPKCKKQVKIRNRQEIQCLLYAGFLKDITFTFRYRTMFYTEINGRVGGQCLERYIH